ncbi:MAG: hypothetical protein M3Y09_13945 [Actinomycetota bacterium]|nr:hypothetical protein [Actinomycetota bacterium]
MRKMQAPVRLFPPLWEHLEQLVRELSDEGLEVDKTALLNPEFRSSYGVIGAKRLV